MARTGAQLLTGFSQFLDDEFASTTTTTGLVTTLVDTALGRWNDRALIGAWLRPTGAANQYAIRRISNFVQSTGTATVLPAFAAVTTTAQAYGLHFYDPELKFRALDQAAIEIVDDVFRVIYDETVTTDGINDEYAIPAAVRRGPAFIYYEVPVPVQPYWNFLANPRGDSLTSWTLAGAGAASVIYTPSTTSDILIPKYGTSCTKISVADSTATTYRQVVADMLNGVTAVLAAGRRMTMGMWVYCRIASRVTIEFRDLNGQVAASAAHGGAGWELLTVSGNVSAANTTTLTAGIAITSGVVLELYWNNAWFFYGDRMPSHFYEDRALTVLRDDTNQRIILPGPIRSKLQLRIPGQAALTQLGTTAATQVTNSMEVDIYSAQLLFARAAEILLGFQMLRSPQLAEVAARIQYVRARREELRTKWAYRMPYAKIRGPYD